MPDIRFEVTGLDAATIAVVETMVSGAITALQRSVEDNGAVESLLVHGWDEAWVLPFLARVQGRGGRQAAVIETIAATGGEIDRATLMATAGFSRDRNLTGFTKPVKGALRALMTTVGLPAGADGDDSPANPLRPAYRNGPGRASHFVMDPDLASMFHRVLGADSASDR